MKRLILIILSVIMILPFSSCSGTANVPDEVRRISTFYAPTGEGEFLYDSKLSYVDYRSLQQAVVCPYPNCPHTDPETCSAYGMVSSMAMPVYYNGHIYFFSQKSEYQSDGELKIYSEIFKANSDGTSRIKLDDVDGGTVNLSFNWVVGDKLYFTPQSFKMENGISSNYTKYTLWEFDFNTEKTEYLCDLIEGLYIGARINGYFDGKLYINVSRSKEQKELSVDEIMTANIEYESYDCIYDIETGELTKWDKCAANGNGKYLTVGDEDKTEVYTLDGKVYDMENISGYLQIVNDFIIDGYAGKAIDLKTGKIYKALIGKDTEIVAYVDGKYIGKTRVMDGGNITGYTYAKYDGEEIFGEES